MKVGKAVVAGMLLAIAGGALGAESKVDVSIGKKLEAEGLKYEIDADGDYKLLYDVGDGRSQIVWVRSAVETFGSLRIREVLSVAGRMPKTDGDGVTGIIKTTALTIQALRESSEQKLGGWVLKGEPDKTESFFYVAQIPADASAEDLAYAATLVAKNADAFEKEAIEALDPAAKKDTF